MLQSVRGCSCPHCSGDRFRDQALSIIEEWLAASRAYAKACGRLAAYSCAYCGATAETLDHVTPRKHGGSNDPLNLVPACRACNKAKGNSLDSSWYLRAKAYLRGS